LTYQIGGVGALHPQSASWLFHPGIPDYGADDHARNRDVAPPVTRCPLKRATRWILIRPKHRSSRSWANRTHAPLAKSPPSPKRIQPPTCEQVGG